jgi:hypothetical protein
MRDLLKIWASIVGFVAAAIVSGALAQAEAEMKRCSVVHCT